MFVYLINGFFPTRAFPLLFAFDTQTFIEKVNQPPVFSRSHSQKHLSPPGGEVGEKTNAVKLNATWREDIQVETELRCACSCITVNNLLVIYGYLLVNKSTFLSRFSSLYHFRKQRRFFA